MNYDQSDSASEHETKFVLNNSCAHVMIQWLQHRCQQDSRFPSGIISTIYYDTRDWRFLSEKINSDYLKTKIRLRWYSDFHNGEPGDASYMEIKRKIGNRRQKIRIKTGLPGKWLSHINLDHQRLLKIPHVLRSKGIFVPGHLLPVFQINYRRYRFVEPITRARLCIDYDIFTPSVNPQMLSRTNPLTLKNAVFELKGKLSKLPEVLHQLTALGCSKQSFSKYSVCYKHISSLQFH